MYVYYLTRGSIVSPRAFNFLTRAFNLPTRAFNLAARAFSLLSRGFELVTHGFKLVTRSSQLVFYFCTSGFMYGLCKVHEGTTNNDNVTPFHPILPATVANLAKSFVPISKQFEAMNILLKILFHFVKNYLIKIGIFLQGRRKVFYGGGAE